VRLQVITSAFRSTNGNRYQKLLGDWRKVHEKLHDVYSSHTGEKIRWVNLKERDNLNNARVDGRVILKRI
jgi:hypothetical protein